MHLLPMLLTLASTLSLLLGRVSAATASQWRGRSVYQVLTDRYALANGSTTAPCDPSVGKYCGGTYKGIEGHLDYIQNMGFGAIWISPHTAQLPQYTDNFAAYHGYWQQNIYEINDKFGSEEDLQDLVNAVHNRGMYIMFDIVVNHMAWSGDAPSVQYDRLIPFNDKKYYHDYCKLTNSTSQTDCWLGDEIVTLPDLKTEDKYIQDTFNNWISDVVSEYNVDGLRLDSAGNVNGDFFRSFCDAAGIYCLGEVYSGNPTYACPYQEDIDGVMNYPAFFPITRALQATNGSFDDVVDMLSQVIDGCKDTTLMGVFTENHDQPRFASYTDDLSLAKNIISYTLMSDGIPILYQGQEQHLSGRVNPLNREAIWLTGFPTDAPLYNLTSSLNILRSFAAEDSTTFLTTPMTILANTTSHLAIRKDRVITLLNNFGADAKPESFAFSVTAPSTKRNREVETRESSGTMMLDVVSCKSYEVNDRGELEVSIENGLPMVFYEQSRLERSAVCNGGKEDGLTMNPNIVQMDPPPKKSEAQKKQEWLKKVLGVVGAVLVGGLI